MSDEYLNKEGVQRIITWILGLYGAPGVASTAAGMTDINKVYVYTGSETGYATGHWYYYNGSAWTDGGVYNAVAVETDKTLRVQDKAADGKATGEAIGELSDKLIGDKALDVSSATKMRWQVLNTNKWSAVTSGNSRCSVVPIPQGALSMTVEASPNNSYIAFFDTYTGPVAQATPDFSDNYEGRIVLNSGQTATYIIEPDMHYLYLLRLNSSNADVTPTIIYEAVKTDATLSKEDAPADAKAAGDELALATRLKPFDGGTRLENQSPNTFCRVANVEIDEDDKPDSVDLKNFYGWLFTHKGSANGIQILWYSHANIVYRRYFRSGGYSAWQGIGNAIKQELSILVIGNSFDQDSYAYLPAILKETVPDLSFRIIVLYTASASVAQHVEWFNSDTVYTITNSWRPNSTKWTRTKNANTLRYILGKYEWDIICTNHRSADTIDAASISSMLRDARDLLKILQENTLKPFKFIWNQIMARPYQGLTIDEMYTNGLAAMEAVKAGVGIYDYIPIGTAIQNARTNATLDALGDGGHMMYSDQTHMQAGITPLIASYSIAEKIIQAHFGMKAPILGCKWVPTQENVTEIHAEWESGSGMTHGIAAGAVIENVRAAQEIATLAVNRPDVLSDCADVL